MITRFEILSAVSINAFIIVSALVGGVWKIRGWVDSLTAADKRLADAITSLTSQLRQMHSDNQSRFSSIENSLRRRGPR